MNPQFYEHPRTIDGKLTAVAVLTDYWDEISKFWNDETAKQYIEYYDIIILPYFALRPIEEFANQQAYEDIIDKIQSGGTISDPESGRYGPATLQKFRHLIRLVLKVAAKHDICLDVLWGTGFAAPTDDDPDEAEAYARTRLRKSLMPNEEYALADEVFIDPHQEGERMFALLTYALGGRPQEIADVRWGDIILLNPQKNQYGVALLTTVYGKTSKVGGKTKSMYRFVPISDRLRQFLMERKSAVEQAISEVCIAGDTTSVEKLFVCCTGGNYFQRCNLQHASNVCRDLLRRIGLKETLLRYLEKGAVESSDESVWGKEKSATSYVLRRHYCTQLYALGLEEEEIAYLMGHSMRYMVKKRSDYRYTPFQDRMCNRLAYRPIMNPFPDWDADAFLINDQEATSTHKNVPQRNIRLDHSNNGGILTIRITPNEANDPICIDIEALSPDGTPISINGTYETTEAHGDQRKGVSVIADLLRMYQNAQKRVEDSSAFVRRYGGKQSVNHKQTSDFEGDN